MQPTPSKIINAYLKWHISLLETEAQIIQFTNLPINTPGLDLLAGDIVKKFGFIRNFLVAESVSSNSMPDDLLEIQGKLLDLESEFYQSNLRHADQENDDSEIDSVCESCLNYDREFEGEAASDAPSVHEGSEMLREYTVPQSPGEFHDSTVPSPEKVELPSPSEFKREKTRKRRRKWWWRTMVILMPASLVILAVSYFEKKQHEGFPIPT